MQSKRFDEAGEILKGVLDSPAQTLQARLSAGAWLLDALLAARRPSDAQAALPRVAALFPQDTQKPAWFSRLAWRLDASWWRVLIGPRIRLRRPQADDADWLRDAFLDDAFASAVNRSYAERIRKLTSARVAQLLGEHLMQSPLDLGMQMFIIERVSDGRLLGLASFVSIDLESRRAEFIIGFVKPPAHGLWVLEAGVLLAEFAFSMAKFRKITVSIYGDNPRRTELMDVLSRLGFKVEGLQRAHVRTSHGQYVDIHLMAALQEDVLNHPCVNTLAQRFLGRRLG